MPENMPVYALQSRQAVFVWCCLKTYTASYETEQADVANEHLPVLYCRFVEMNIKHCAVRFMVCGFQASVLC